MSTCFSSPDWTIIKTSSSLVGKLFIACVMATLYSYTSELFPTSSRSAVVGLCSTSGRVGGVLAPVISDWVNSEILFDNRRLTYCFCYASMLVILLTKKGKENR